MTYRNRFKIVILLFTVLFLPVTALAGGEMRLDEYTPLVGIPGLQGALTFENFVNALYALAISVAALIAVIQIVIAGTQYMLSDIVSSKSAAKERIQNALIGLLIIIGAVTILLTVNEDLVNVNISASQAVVDDSDPNLLLVTPEEHCDGLVAAGLTCTNLACESLIAEYGERMKIYADLDDEQAQDCTQVCGAVGGHRNNDITGVNPCTFDKDLIDGKLSAMLANDNQLCSTDGFCDATLICRPNETRILSGIGIGENCESECFTRFSGTYDNATGGCIHPSGENDLGTFVDPSRTYTNIETGDTIDFVEPNQLNETGSMIRVWVGSGDNRQMVFTGCTTISPDPCKPLGRAPENDNTVDGVVPPII